MLKLKRRNKWKFSVFPTERPAVKIFFVWTVFTKKVVNTRINIFSCEHPRKGCEHLFWGFFAPPGRLWSFIYEVRGLWSIRKHRKVLSDNRMVIKSQDHFMFIILSIGVTPMIYRNLLVAPCLTWGLNPQSIVILLNITFLEFQIYLTQIK